MTDKLRFLAASDKDVFDLLMSSRNKLGDATLRSLGLRRGIIFSPKTERERIVEDLSLLSHDHESLTAMISLREVGQRSEKMTSVTLPLSLSTEEMKAAVQDYRSKCPSDEQVEFQPRRGKDLYFNVSYNEIDYSKTRLIQRQRRDAGIEFVSDETTTTIRMPATEKAREVVEKIKKSIEQQKLSPIDPLRIELKEFNSSQRTNFFMRLMRNMPGYDLETVISMKVASEKAIKDADVLDVDIEETEKVAEAAVGIVNSLIMSGQNLEQSEEYQSFRKKGYYIVSAGWKSVQKAEPQDVMHFDASFDDTVSCTGFKYGARIARRLKSGKITSHFQPLEANRQPAIWRLIETTSASVLTSLKNELSIFISAQAGQKQ